MRKTLNISMPSSLKRSVDLAVIEGNYASVSELFRDALRSLAEDKLVKDIIESEREFARGKGKKLKSLKDLM